MTTELPDEQQEEKEVLLSIYGSDVNFKEVNPSTYQYKVGEVGLKRTFQVEVTWPPAYPEELPIISLNTFYNNHLSQETKKSVCSALFQEVEELLGFPMTYTLFEYCRDNVDTLIPESSVIELEDEGEEEQLPGVQGSSNKTKKEVLSKAAKRRQADRLNAQGELPRGHDWVDIIKHLSKTGNSGLVHCSQ